MSNFEPKKVYLRGILLHYSIQKKSSAEARIIFVETHDNCALSETTFRYWVRCFRNNDFDFEDNEPSRTSTKFQVEQLEALLHEDSCQALPRPMIACSNQWHMA